MEGVDEVEVFVPFTGRWVGGYELAVRSEDGGFFLRRAYDGTVLPTPLPAERVRVARAEPAVPI